MDEQRDNMTRRNALVAAGGLSMSLLADQDVAADEKQDKKEQRKAETYKAPGPRPEPPGPKPPRFRILSREGKFLDRITPGPVLQIQLVNFDFHRPNGNDWSGQSQSVTAPPGWNLVYVIPVFWWFSFLPDDHHIGLIGVNTWTTSDPGGDAAVQVHAAGILRDDNGDDAWNGQITVMVLFLG
jgi:hypothetical protein